MSFKRSYPQLHRISLTQIAFNQIHLGYVRLNLLNLYFHESSQASKKEGLIKAYTTACDLITRVVSEMDTSKSLLYSPGWFFNMLATCAFMFLKILKSSYSQYVDFEAGRKAFNATVLALRRWSIVNNDLSARIAEIVALLSRGLDASTADSAVEPELRYHHRQASDVFWDGLVQWKEDFGGRAGIPLQPSDMSQGATIPDQSFIDSVLFDDGSWMWDYNTLLP